MALTLKQALMNSQDLTESEAESLIGDMKMRIYYGEDPEEILSEEGLEPDYVMDLIEF